MINKKLCMYNNMLDVTNNELIFTIRQQINLQEKTRLLKIRKKLILKRILKFKKEV